MRNDAGPSLFLASAEKAHREHLHQHNLFHKNKRQTEPDTDIQQVVTEVVRTVSYIQQIDVDSNGSTFSTETILVDSTDVPAAITDAYPATTTTEAASPGITTTASSVSSTVVGVSQPDPSPVSQSLLSNLTSTLSSVSSIPTSFASLTISSNSTTLISSSSSLSPFSNSSLTSSSSSSSSTYLYSSSSTSFDDSIYSSSTAYATSYSSESNATPTTGAGGGTGATGSVSTTTAAAGNGTNADSSSTPSTSTVVGGVVGGIAGAAILIFVLMFLLRWKKRHQNMLSLGSGDPGAGDQTARGIGPPPSQPSDGMTQARSSYFAVPAALASLSGFKRSSRQTDQTLSTDGGGEKGFYRVSGRKLPSVLQSGGDGYGDGFVDNTLSGSSFYQDSQGFYGGPSSPTLTAPVGTQRPESGIPVMRPSPARTPVTEYGPFSNNPAPPLTPPHRPDVLGRSHPSQDGSHASRFTEEV